MGSNRSYTSWATFAGIVENEERDDVLAVEAEEITTFSSIGLYTDLVSLFRTE